MTVQADSQDDRAVLELMLRGHLVARTLRLVADLGLADKIAPEGAMAVRDLASMSGVLSEPLLRVLRALEAFRIFQVSPDGFVSHTARSRLLRVDASISMHHGARAWSHSRVPNEAAWDQGRFDYLRGHPDEGGAFDAFTAHFPDDRHAAISAAYDFSTAALIADVGGGSAETLRRILARAPAVRGLLYDQTDVVAAVSPDMLMQGRIEVRCGNFFEAVPSGADVYLLVRVLHKWSDEDCARILAACRAAATPYCRLVLGEHTLEPGRLLGGATDHMLDLQMMAMFGRARQRSVVEFRDMLGAAGFQLQRVIPTTSFVSILEATPG